MQMSWSGHDNRFDVRIIENCFIIRRMNRLWGIFGAAGEGGWVRIANSDDVRFRHRREGVDHFAPPGSEPNDGNLYRLNRFLGSGVSALRGSCAAVIATGQLDTAEHCHDRGQRAAFEEIAAIELGKISLVFVHKTAESRDPLQTGAHVIRSARQSKIELRVLRRGRLRLRISFLKAEGPLNP